MSENTCPNVALSRNQNMWVVKESADKTLEFPAVTDIINVTADVFANQEIPTSDSKEKANTLNKLNVFNSSASPAGPHTTPPTTAFTRAKLSHIHKRPLCSTVWHRGRFHARAAVSV